MFVDVILWADFEYFILYYGKLCLASLHLFALSLYLPCSQLVLYHCHSIHELTELITANINMV